MAEQITPNQESFESQRERLVALLKERGLEDPEAKQLFGEWAGKREAEIEAITDRETSHREQVNFEIQKAQIMYEAGYANEALDILDDARMIASQEGFDDVYAHIMDIMGSI